MIWSSWIHNCRTILLLFTTIILLGGCSTAKFYTAQSFTIAQNQKMVPILPFMNTLVPDSLSEAVFNDYVDAMNDTLASSGFSWFGIIKDDLKEVEKILSPTHIYISGEIWSYIENSGCCATELRVKSRLRIFRVLSRQLLWEADIPLESFFEHDLSTLAAEREKLAKRLSTVMTLETLKALQSAKRIVIE